MKKIMRLLLGSGLAATLLTGCNNGGFIYHGKVYTEKDMSHFYTEKIAIDDLQTIDVESNYADLEIIASDDYYIEYSYYYINKEPTLTIEDKKLTFSDQDINIGSYSINTKETNYLKIYIPTTSDFDMINIEKSSGDCSIGSVKTNQLNLTNQYGETIIFGSEIGQLDLKESSGKVVIDNTIINTAKIENTYGEVVLEGINSQDAPCEQLEVTLSSGSISMNQVFSQKATIENTYGEVEVDDSGFYEVDANMSSGNLTIDYSYIDALSVKNTYGSVELALLGNEEDYQFDIRSSYGEVEIGTNTYEHSVFIDRGGMKKIIVSTSSGNVEIKFIK